jgi:hypothetical protein
MMNQFKKNIYITFFLFLIFGFAACEEDSIDKSVGPAISLQDGLSLDGLNVGDEITVPVEVSSANGVKRISYFFVLENENDTETSDAVNLDDSTYPLSVTKDLQITVETKMIEMVIVAFDRYNTAAEVHIPMANIRTLPQLNFTDGVDYRETVFENKKLKISGHVTSEFEVKNLTYATVVNGEQSEPTAVELENGTDTDFAFDVTAKKGLEKIIVKATNIYDGLTVDTFKIGAVANDAVAITMQGGITEIDKLYADKPTEISGIISSGSDIVSFTYAVKTETGYSEETEITLGTPLDEFNFSVPVTGIAGIEAVRFTGKNENGNELELELPVNKVLFPLVYKKDVVLTTEIGAGKANWFSAYLEPHTFDQETAKTHQEMMDFVVVAYSETSLRFLSAAVYEASSYLPRVAPYMEGFSQATYSVVTSNRPSVTAEAMANLEYDEDLTNFIDNKIVASAADGGENYNVKGTNRRTSGNLEEGSGLIIGWGSYVNGAAANQEFAVIYVKEITIENGVGVVRFDIKYPQTDYRSVYNPVSILPYP